MSSSSDCLENGQNGHDEEYLDEYEEYAVSQEHADIVRADEVVEEDLPHEAFTKNMLAKFKSLEDTNMEPPTPESSQQKMKVAKLSIGPGPTRKFSGRASSPTPVDNYLDEREQPDGLEQTEVFCDYDYNQEIDSGEYENNPNRNADVIREDDILTDDLPEQGTTQNLLAKFQSMQSS